MVDEVFVDTFGDNDLADPQLLPTGTKFLGEITAADTKGATPGNYRQFSKPLKDGRTEVPIIGLQIRARKFADGRAIEGNFQTLLNSDFWLGSTDVIGRSSYARLCAGVLGVKKEELSGSSLTSLAKDIVGGKVSFDVTHREYTTQDGTQAKVQGMSKLKAASADEMAVMAG